MANQLKMAIVQSIKQLQALQWSQRRIARELGIDRGTVARYLKSDCDAPKPAISPAGCWGSNAATVSGPPALGLRGADGAGPADCAADSKPAISPPGSAGVANSPPPPISPPTPRLPVGRPSECAAYRELILAGLEQELSAQRIWQDLVAEHGFQGSYDSVKRFVRRHSQQRPVPFRRMEVASGQEAQVDFGSGAPILMPNGRRRKTNVFRIVLSQPRNSQRQIVAVLGRPGMNADSSRTGINDSISRSIMFARKKDKMQNNSCILTRMRTKKTSAMDCPKRGYLRLRGRPRLRGGIVGSPQRFAWALTAARMARTFLSCWCGNLRFTSL